MEIESTHFLCLRCCYGWGDCICVDEIEYAFLQICSGCGRIGDSSDFLVIADEVEATNSMDQGVNNV